MSYNVAIVGATGNVGRMILQTLEDRGFPVDRVFCVASPKSAGKTLQFKGEQVKVQPLKDFDFSQVDLVLSSPGSAISAGFADKAAESGAIVIDNTSYFRMEEDVPLVVPEVNPQTLEMHAKRKIIANPNCNVIPISVVLKPLLDVSRIKRMVISTYQSVSGAGKAAMDELFNQTKARFENSMVQPQAFPHPIAFNVIPQVGDFDEDGHADEEVKTEKELQKILEIDADITVTCARVPTFVGHSASVNIEFEDEFIADAARDILYETAGVAVLDDREQGGYITPLDTVGGELVYVSRIRNDRNSNKCLNLWISSDNLRKGAALNTVQIAEKLIEEYIL